MTIFATASSLPTSQSPIEMIGVPMLSSFASTCIRFLMSTRLMSKHSRNGWYLKLALGFHVRYSHVGRPLNSARLPLLFSATAMSLVIDVPSSAEVHHILVTLTRRIVPVLGMSP